MGALLHTTFGDFQRALDKLLAQPQRVHVCMSRYDYDALFQEYRSIHEVLVDGEIYHVTDRELHALQDGITPDELCLDPVDDDGRI